MKFNVRGPKDLAEWFCVSVVVGVVIFAILYVGNTFKTHERWAVDDAVRVAALEVFEHYEDLARDTILAKKVMPDEKFDHTKTIEGVSSIPEGTTIFIKAAKTPGKVCVYAINPNGDMSAEGVGIVRGNAPTCSNIKNPERNIKPQDVVDAVKDF